MSATSSCPDPARLHSLLNAQVAEAEQAELTSHLESCENCQQKLDELAAGHDSWSDARELRERRPVPDSALHRVMQKLKGQTNQRTHAESPPEESLPLDFLSPPDSPDYLGQLGPYGVMKVIGRGGMGVVLKALDPSLQRIVAVKVLTPHLA